MKRFTSILIAVAIGMLLFTAINHKPLEVITAPTTQGEYITAQVTAQPEPIREEWICTAYCPCQICGGRYSAQNRSNGIVIGAQGTELIQGLSMASGLPYGTVVHMTGTDGYNGFYLCQDRPAEYILKRYDNKVIDIFFNSHAQAEAFGKRTVLIEIIGKGE